jgi:hypothetical protein
MERLIVYSCVSGGYDQQKEDRWYCEPAKRLVSHRMKAKQPKILPHKYFPDHEFTIWADSNLELKMSGEEILDFFGHPDVGVFEHPLRKTINEEIKATWGMDAPENLEYHRDGEGRLGSCNLIIRRNTPEVNQLCEAWWAEICVGSSRDQLSFPYTLGTIAKMLPNPNVEYLMDNPVYKAIKHNGSRYNF